MDFSIRQATRDDYEELCGLFAEGDAYHREALPHVFQQPEGPARSLEYVMDILGSDEAALFVAEQAGQIVGLVHVLLRESPPIPIMVPRRYAVIDNLVVRAAFRRSGVGQALVEKAHEWARSRGVTRVELHVWEFNTPAIALYEKLGYTTAGRRMWKCMGPEEDEQ
jgi:ribosomal protein S18 acetylase RimI-like enzyme